jgi:Family of unknown function (DUF5670)
VFLIIALVLFVLWIVGFAFFRAILGGAIHLILVIAIIVLVWYFVAGHSSPRVSRGDGSTTSGAGRA